MKIIDLSIPIEDGLPSDPPIQIPKIQYCNHKDTAEQMAGFFKGLSLIHISPLYGSYNSAGAKG